MVGYKVEWVTIAAVERCIPGICPHCACDSSPDKTGEIPFDILKTKIDQFPEAGVDYVSFDSDGEQTLYPHFLEAIAYLDDLRKRTGHPKKIGLGTNGRWAPDRKTALKTIREYGKNGLDRIYVSANMYHYNLYQRQIEVLKELCKENLISVTSLIEDVEVSLTAYKEYPTVLPLGRAKNFPESKSTRYGQCQLMKLHLNYEGTYVGGLSIFHDGYYVCGWKVFRIGDLNENLINVFKRNVHNPLRQLLVREDYGPKRFLTENAVRKALPQEFMEKVENLKECAACKELFESEEARKIAESIAPIILKTLQ